MRNEEKLELIDSFLQGSISEEDQRELDLLRSDPEFEEEFLFRQEAYQSAKTLGRNELKSRLKKLDQPKKVVKFRMWWAVAAVGILLLMAVPYMLKPSSSEALFAEYYTKMPNKLRPITRGDDQSDPLKLGFLAYQRSNYSEAKAIFSEQLSNTPNVEVYLGIIALEEDRYQDAISILTRVAKNQQNRFKEEANWYLAMAYIANSENLKAEKTLQDLTKGKNRYLIRAKALLKEIEK